MKEICFTRQIRERRFVLEDSLLALIFNVFLIKMLFNIYTVVLLQVVFAKESYI